MAGSNDTGVDEGASGRGSAGLGPPDSTARAERVRLEGRINPGPELSPEAEGEGAREGNAPGARAGMEMVDICPFLALEKKPLLKVFVFLSAPEVLRAAQVCRPMFRKVIAYKCNSSTRECAPMATIKLTIFFLGDPMGWFFTRYNGISLGIQAF